jgi:hypothetical protein
VAVENGTHMTPNWIESPDGNQWTATRKGQYDIIIYQRGDAYHYRANKPKEGVAGRFADLHSAKIYCESFIGVAHTIPTALPIGTIIRTNGEGPYLITKILGPCHCPAYLDTINMCNPPQAPEHYHLTMRHQTRNTDGYLNDMAVKNGQIINVHRGPADIRIIGREAVAHVAEQLSLF